MYFLEIDIVGILVFLWFIFKGLRQSQNAKQEHEQKQRERMGKTKPRSGPVIEKRPVVEEEKDIPTFNPFPTWFPFPIPIEIEVEEPKPKPKRKKNKAKPKPVITEVRQEEREEKRKRADREVKSPSIWEDFSMPVNPITQGELEWKNKDTGLELDRKALVNGIILSEILGPPKARRIR